jgi:molybdate transport system substrate-binding protein
LPPAFRRAPSKSGLPAPTRSSRGLEQIGPEFENATGHKFVFAWGQVEILNGRSFDVAVLTAAIIDELTMQGGRIGATRTSVAVSEAGLAVRKGAAKPDISTVDSFKPTLLYAGSITFAERGGTGAYLKAVFLRLGTADALTAKHRPLRSVKGPAEAVVDGEAEIGLTQISVSGRRVGGTAAARSPAHHHLCDRRCRGAHHMPTRSPT